MIRQYLTLLIRRRYGWTRTLPTQSGVKKLLTTVPVRKPNRQDFVRVHPDAAYRLTPAAIIELKEDREVYLVTPRMAIGIAGRIRGGDLIHNNQPAGGFTSVAGEAARP